MTWIPTKIKVFLFEPMTGNFPSKHVDSAMPRKKWKQNYLKTSGFYSMNIYCKPEKKKLKS